MEVPITYDSFTWCILVLEATLGSHGLTWHDLELGQNFGLTWGCLGIDLGLTWPGADLA